MKETILSKKHYFLETTKDVSDIYEPLKRYGITFFCYGRIYNNGLTYSLVSHAESHYHHFNSQYEVCPLIPKALLAPQFYYIPLPGITCGFSQAFNDYTTMFNMSFPIYLFERYEDYTDLFIYGSTSDNPGIINFYLNNMDVLEKFKFYFKDKARKLIEASSKHSIILPKHMYVDFCNLQQPSAKTLDKEKLLEELDAKRYTLPGIYSNITITKREMDVIKHLATGCTVKEAAKQIDISPRTAETYLNSIKSRLGVQKKSEIIKILSEFNLF